MQSLCYECQFSFFLEVESNNSKKKKRNKGKSEKVYTVIVFALSWEVWVS